MGESDIVYVSNVHKSDAAIYSAMVNGDESKNLTSDQLVAWMQKKLGPQHKVHWMTVQQYEAQHP